LQKGNYDYKCTKTCLRISFKTGAQFPQGHALEVLNPYMRFELDHPTLGLIFKVGGQDLTLKCMRVCDACGSRNHTSNDCESLQRLVSPRMDVYDREVAEVATDPKEKAAATTSAVSNVKETSKTMLPKVKLSVKKSMAKENEVAWSAWVKKDL
jgi:hypothetical protein